MREKFGFLIWLWFLLCGNCLGRFSLEKNSLKVLSPQWIKGVYECAIENIGLPRYGGTLFGTVVYPTANRDACWSFDDVGSFKLNPGSLPIILLVDRGECYFTVKAWNAQIAGAAAVLVVDNKDEPLITVDTLDEEYPNEGYTQGITIPSALISKQLGESIKNALTGGDTVVLNLDLTESLPHHLESDEQALEYEFWTNSNYECGPSCHEQIDFISSFKDTAHMLAQGGHTRFTPHYITWYCPEAFILSKQCRSQCIRHGRYCAADPAVVGYDGRDVVVQNLRQACVFKVAKQSGKPWLWWDYVTEFALRCSMKEYKFTSECADLVIRSLGILDGSVDDCIGDVDADVDHPVLKAEQNAQVGKGIRGDVTMLPTLMINNRHYRGKLEKTAVLETIWAGFNDKNAKPSISLSKDGETNEHVVVKDWW